MLQLQQAEFWKLLQMIPVVRRIQQSKRQTNALTAILLH